MPLDGNLPYLFAFAMMRKPGVVKIGANKHQFKVVDNFNMVANDPFLAPFALVIKFNSNSS